MSWQTLLLFVGSTFFVSATPGANMVYAFQMGLTHGFKKTLIVMAGLSAGLGVLLALALFGLGLMARYPMILLMIKILGAVYLLYLGVKSWQSNQKLTQDKSTSTVSPLTLFKNGVWVSLSNPKAILFFSAFFPKFINFNAPLMPQYVVLIGVFFIIETLCQSIYAIGGISLATWLNADNRMIYLNRLCGAIFVLIATLLLYDSVGELSQF